MTRPVYLDHNATTPVRPAAAAAVTAALAETGNPSSVHRAGQAARRRIEAARAAVAALVGVPADSVTFTSGGTEANTWALAGPATARRLGSAVEHDSILARPGLDTVPVDGDGVVDGAALAAMLAAGSPRGTDTVVAVMLANNVTGVIQPVAEVARIVHAHGARLHVDAAQAAGRIPIDMAALGADTLTVSAHKLGGPPGVGALIHRPGQEPPPRLLHGGGQERRRRPGTENGPGIAGFAAAVPEAHAELADFARLGAWRDRLEREARALAPNLVVLGAGAPRLPNTTCLALPGLPADVAVMAFDLEAVAISAGSACRSGRAEPSPVPAAMGLPPAVATAAFRVSLGWTSRESDVDRFLAVFGDLLARTGLDGVG